MLCAASTKTSVKKAVAGIALGSVGEAQQAVRQAISILDRSAKKGVIHPNNAARRKSRLSRKLNAAAAVSQPSAPEPTVSEKAEPKKRRTVLRKKTAK